MPDTPRTTISESTKRTRRKAAGLIRIAGWVQPDEYWTAVARRLEREQAKADRIAATPGRRGRPKESE